MAGRVPPPHLSQFMDNEAEGYVPKYADTIKRFQAAARKEVLPMPGVVGDEELDNPQNLLAEGIINRAKAIEAAERKRKMSVLQEQYHSELKKELHGEQFYSIPSAIKHESAEDTGNGEDFLPELQRVAEDAANMSKVVMSCKKRRLYEAMKIGEEQKKAETGRIKERKRRLTESENLK